MQRTFGSLRLLAALAMAFALVTVTGISGFAQGQGQNQVFVCNLASGNVIEVSAAAVNQGTVGFPFRLATSTEITAGACNVATTAPATTQAATTQAATTQAATTQAATTQAATTAAATTAAATTAAATTQAPSQTGTITILKRVCEEDRSGMGGDNCTGRVEEAEGTTFTFRVFAGATTTGTPVQNIGVLIAQQGNGSQGQATGAALTAGATFTVCEVPLAGFTVEPRPDNQGGANQTEVGNCIQVVLTPGNNVLQFNNFVNVATTQPATTQAATTQAATTQAATTKAATTKAATQAATTRAATTGTKLPNTGSGSGMSGGSPMVWSLAALVALVMAGLAAFGVRMGASAKR